MRQVNDSFRPVADARPGQVRGTLDRLLSKCAQLAL